MCESTYRAESHAWRHRSGSSLRHHNAWILRWSTSGESRLDANSAAVHGLSLAENNVARSMPRTRVPNWRKRCNANRAIPNPTSGRVSLSRILVIVPPLLDLVELDVQEGRVRRNTSVIEEKAIAWMKPSGRRRSATPSTAASALRKCREIADVSCIVISCRRMISE